MKHNSVVLPYYRGLIASAVGSFLISGEGADPRGYQEKELKGSFFCVSKMSADFSESADMKPLEF